MMNGDHHDHLYYHRWDSPNDIDRCDYDRYLLPDTLTTDHLLHDDHDLTLHITLC